MCIYMRSLSAREESAKLDRRGGEKIDARDSVALVDEPTVRSTRSRVYSSAFFSPTSSFVMVCCDFVHWRVVSAVIRPLCLVITLIDDETV